MNQKAAATPATIATVPTSEWVNVRCPSKNASAPPNRVIQSTSAIKPETSSIGVAARVILFRPARPRAKEVSACVTGSMMYQFASVILASAFGDVVESHRLWGLFLPVRSKIHRLKSALLTSPREILQRIGYCEGERVGHNPKLDWQTSGRLPVHLDLHLGRAV